MSGITYVIGDATAPNGNGPKIIAHVCNDIGRWGKGFVMALSRRWKKPEAEYRAWYGAHDGFELGAMQLVQVEDALWVANLIGQHGIKRAKTGPPIRYDAIAKSLEELGAHAKSLKASVHMPRIGCGLAGGEWGKIEPLIEQHLVARRVSVTIYDLA